ncbi:uncharacterized protein LOC130635920 [Hydractinia symbiolongicarpus]|uniref:uncharacterized protein LOC130635920 n=1 Tax=Hydractinia symbiolongicarpus TaxID=13093 RepID=UPI002550555B|nr:uncharacterized protein LOC130635920 [Hydractinia symbiolongicarpus]
MKFIVLLTIFCVCVSASSLVSMSPEDTNVTEGDTVSLDCVTSLTVNITWFHNGKTVDCTTFFCNVYKNNTLFINKIEHFHEGNYFCASLNGDRTVVESNTAYLRVFYLSIFGSVKNVSATYDSVIFSVNCVIRADPLPAMVTWKHNSTVITNNVRQQLSFTVHTKTFAIANLRIYNIREADVGWYTCEADNTFFRKSHFAGAIVDFKRKCKHGWACVNIRRCIRNSQHCNNIDDCGDLSDEKINCFSPGKIAGFEVTVRNYHTVEFSWKYNFRAINYTLTLKQGGYIKTYVLQSVYKRISDLQNGTSYQVQLYAENYVGKSNPTEWINFTLPKLVTPGPVRNISAVRISVGNTFKMLIEYLPPLEDGGGRFTVYCNKLCRYNIKSNISMNCTTRETLVTSYTAEKQLADTTYKITIYVTNEAKLEGPSMYYIYTTPSYKKPTVTPCNNEKSGMSDRAITGIVFAISSALSMITIWCFRKCYNDDY